MQALKILSGSLAILVLAALAGCIERPNDEVLRPPPEVSRALDVLGERAVQSSRKLATQAQRESGQLVKRSASVTGPVLAQAILHGEAQASRAGPRPIPEPIAKVLAPHFKPDLMKSVGWTSAPAGSISAPC